MAQKQKVVLWSALVVVAALAAVFTLFGPAAGDTNTPVILRPEGPASACIVTAKDASIHARKGKNVVWHIQNYCPSDQVVLLGNFRKDEKPQSLPSGCADATYGGAPYPFQQTSDEKRRAAMSAGAPYEPTEDAIKLTVRQFDSLSEYYFDICLPNNGHKADPRLGIDP